MKNLIAGLAALALLGGAVGQARADLITEDLTYNAAGQVLVDGGTQNVPAFYANWFSGTATITNTDILYSTDASFAGGLGFNGFVINEVAGDPFTGASLVSSTFPGFDASRVSFDASHVYADYEGLMGIGTVDIAFTTARTVPEPSSLVLLGMGAAGLAVCEWRRWKRARAWRPGQTGC
jgi:PEP-CTERM motif